MAVHIKPLNHVIEGPVSYLTGVSDLCVDWSKVNKNQYLEAMTTSVANDSRIRILLKSALSDKIDDREMFMKGIDYSYYYEESES